MILNPVDTATVLGDLAVQPIEPPPLRRGRDRRGARKAFAGTGSFIGQRHVLTAGQVLCDPGQGGWATSILVIPGRDANTAWFGSEQLTWPNFKQRSVSGWSDDQDIDYDYG